MTERRHGWIPVVASALAAALASAGCQTAHRPVRPVTVLRALFTDQDRVFANLVRAHGDPEPQEWTFATPHRLRPCCAFGSGLSVRVGYLPIAGLRLDNVVAANDLGLHRYNSGIVSLENEPSNAFVSPEKNGLVFTCRGGFIDTAHIRDYADWMVFLVGRIRPLLDTGGTIVLPREGGERYVHVAVIPPSLLEKAEREEIAIRLAQWSAVYLAIWHETATWYGWSSWGIFPETASAFSPEDLYSNLVGIMLATELVREGLTSNEAEYDAAMDAAMPELLRRFGAAPKDITRAALQSVDGVWWDSTRPLPDRGVLLRRSFDIGPELMPWMPPMQRAESHQARVARDYCAERNDRPLPLRYPTEVAGHPLHNLVRVEVDPDNRLEPILATPRPEGSWVTQEDFPAIVSRARLENLEEFGRNADRP